MNYLMESTACITVFYGLYLLIFRRFTFVRLNRIYLLLSLIMGLIFPLISYEVEEIVKVPVNQVVYSERNFQPVLVNSSTSLIVNEPVENVIDWNFMIEIIYVLGIVLMAFRFLIMIYKLLKIKRVSVSGDYISTQSRFANSSFFNMVFIDDAKLTENEIQQILAHEKWHIKLFHSYDLLFVEILKMLFWFNPILWLYQRSLSEVHEYEVDTRMIQAYNPQSYAQLLLKLATSNSTLATTHHFSRKPLTDRIHFIFTKQKSVPMKRLAYLSILPIFGVLFMAFSLEKVVKYQEVEKPDEKYFKIYEKPDSQVNNEVLVKKKKIISNLIYGKNRIALTMNPKELSMDAIVSASQYFKKIGFNLEVQSSDYHNSSKQLDKFEISITEDTENKKKYRSEISDTKSELPSKFIFDLQKMKGKNFDYIVTIFADRSTGEHFVASLAPPPPPPVPPRPPLAPKAPRSSPILPAPPKPPLAPKALPEPPKPPVKVGFLNKMSRDSIKLIGEGQLGKNPLVIINGKQYSSDVLYKINTDKISNTATYQKEAVMKKFGVDNADGAIEINTFNRSDENLFLSKKQSAIAFENEKKRNQARLSGKSLTRVTLKDFSGKEKDELIVYKNGQHRASVTVSKGAEVLFMVGNVVKSEEEMKYIEPQLLGNTCLASQDKKEINKLGIKIDNKKIEAVMKFNY